MNARCDKRRLSEQVGFDKGGDDQHAQRNGDRFGGGFRQAKHSDFSSSQGVLDEIMRMQD